VPCSLSCLGFLLLGGGAAPLQAQSSDYLYWSGAFLNNIGRAKLDGTEIVHPFLPVYSPTGIAVNDEYLYWVKYEGGFNNSYIGRARLDMTEINPHFIIPSSFSTWGVAVDDQYIYWTNAQPFNNIGRAKLDGSEVNNCFIENKGGTWLGGAPRGIAVKGGYLYWTNYWAEHEEYGIPRYSIGRAKSDGTEVDSFWIKDCGISHGIALTETHIYWTNYSGSIDRAKLDGTEAEVWLNIDLLYPVGIGIKDDFIYWGEALNETWFEGRIGRAKLDKSFIEKELIVGYGGFCIALSPERIEYTFAGFFSPVENTPVVNKANAGQAIPVKWRITDKNGLPISDPASFKSITSYSVNCAAFAGEPTSTVVEELAAGSSGLQYLGNGWWQFNWKTSKSYKGQCRIMKLTLDDKSEHTASFSFK
jgi:hypothetical protein